MNDKAILGVYIFGVILTCIAVWFRYEKEHYLGAMWLTFCLGIIVANLIAYSFELIFKKKLK